MEKARLHLFLSGKVQGVRFRLFTLESSSKFNINGWVRNRFNRNVEVMAEGNKEKLEKFLKLLEKGPPRSDVESIKKEWLPATGDFKKFRIRFTC